LLAAIISPRNIYPARKVERPKEVLKEKTENNNLSMAYFPKPLGPKLSSNQSLLDKSSLFSIVEKRAQSPTSKMVVTSARNHYQPKLNETRDLIKTTNKTHNDSRKDISMTKENTDDHLIKKLEKKLKVQNKQNKGGFKGDKKSLRLDLVPEKLHDKASLNSERTVFNTERPEVNLKKGDLDTDRSKLKTERSVEREKPFSSKIRESSSNNNRSVNKIQSPRGNISLNPKVSKTFTQDKSLSSIKRVNESQNQSQNISATTTEGVPRRFIELTKNIFTANAENPSVELMPNRKDSLQNLNTSSIFKREVSSEQREPRLGSSSNKKVTKKSVLNSLMNPSKIGLRVGERGDSATQKTSPAKVKMQIMNRLPLHKLLGSAKPDNLRCVTSFRDSSCDNTQDQTRQTEKEELSSIMGSFPKTTTNKVAQASQAMRQSLNDLAGAKSSRNYHQDDLTYGLGFMSSRATFGKDNKPVNKNETSFEFGFRPVTEGGVLSPRMNNMNMNLDKRRGSKTNTTKDLSQEDSRTSLNLTKSRVFLGSASKKNIANKNKENSKVSFEHKHSEKQANGYGHGSGTCCKCGNPTKKQLQQQIQAQNAYYK